MSYSSGVPLNHFGGNAKVKHYPIWILAHRNNKKQKIVRKPHKSNPYIFTGC